MSAAARVLPLFTTRGRGWADVQRELDDRTTIDTAIAPAVRKLLAIAHDATTYGRAIVSRDEAVELRAIALKLLRARRRQVCPVHFLELTEYRPGYVRCPWCGLEQRAEIPTL